MSKPSRRALLKGAAGAAALVGAIPTALVAGNATSPRIVRLRDLASRIVAIEQTPDYAEEELDALLDEIKIVAEEIWDSPVRGPTDILERALIAHSYWADGVGDDGEHVLCYFDAEDGPEGDRAVCHLIDAILELASERELKRTQKGLGYHTGGEPEAGDP